VAGGRGSRQGLLTASFIPPRPIREVRALTPYRTTLLQERAQEINRRRERCGSAPT
jgi:hypothetical protein